MSEPILTLSETKLWLRVETSEEDSLITALIADATELVETYLKRPVIGTADENAVCKTIDDVPESLKIAALSVMALKYEKRDATADDVSDKLLTNAGLDKYIDWSA